MEFFIWYAGQQRAASCTPNGRSRQYLLLTTASLRGVLLQLLDVGEGDHRDGAVLDADDVTSA